MKKWKYLQLGLCLLGTSLLSSCSEISDSRLILTDAVIIPIEKIDETEFMPTVLVEDFTGQMCTWCPDGARLLSDLRSTYGDTRIIPVSIHAGSMGVKNSPTMVGLMNDLGEYYWTKNGFSESTAQPTAVFNRRKISDNRSQWASFVVDELTRECGIAIAASMTLEAGETIKMSIEIASKEPLSCHLQLWLVEDGIIAPQMDHGNVCLNYVHNHILRMSLNGEDGEIVTLGEKTVTQKLSFSIPEDYVIENCYIIAFVYDNNGVLKTVSARLQS